MNLAGKALGLVLLAACCAPGLAARSVNDERLHLYDVKHYYLNISFDIHHRSFTGSVRVTATALMAMETCVLSASNETLTVDSVLWNGARIPYEHTNDHLVAALGSTVRPQATIDLAVHYHGVSRFDGRYEGGGVSFDMVRGSARIASSSEPSFARMWWPCKDLPDDKATATVRIRVPKGLTDSCPENSSIY